MYLLNHASGRRYAPLDSIEIHDISDGMIIVSDGARRVYLRTQAVAPLRFTIGGAAGLHTILHITANHRLIDRAYFRVEATTQLNEASSVYHDLLANAYFTLISPYEGQALRWNGRIYRVFDTALREHVHMLKALRLFQRDVYDGSDIYRESQRADGMIWSNIGADSDLAASTERLADGDFIQPFADESGAFTRVPVEADSEYLFVEAVYATWQATGDDGWMQAALDPAVRALDYTVRSPYRWSEQFGLIKRGYTIDNGNILAETERVIEGDAQRIAPEQTRFGVMFGDNTGYIAACRVLAAMLDHAGRSADAERFRERADTMQVQLATVSWEDSFFIHHVPEQYGLIRDFGVDEDSQLSQSNAFSLNRGISHEQATAIIGSYQQLRNQLPEAGSGEWYTIYPAFQHGFGAGLAVEQGLNGSVTPMVAGELARGAFAHGFESYAVAILNQVAALAEVSGSTIDAVVPPAQNGLAELSARSAAAAVAIALIEGLAGVVDQATTFTRALLAPRWLAAAVDEAQVCVAYPASAGYVAYRYDHDSANRQIFLTITGSGERIHGHILLPAFAQNPQVIANATQIAHQITMVEQSRYVDFDLDLPGPVAVTISY